MRSKNLYCLANKTKKNISLDTERHLKVGKSKKASKKRHKGVKNQYCIFIMAYVVASVICTPCSSYFIVRFFCVELKSWKYSNASVHKLVYAKNVLLCKCPYEVLLLCPTTVVDDSCRLANIGTCNGGSRSYNHLRVSW